MGDLAGEQAAVKPAPPWRLTTVVPWDNGHQLRFARQMPATGKRRACTESKEVTLFDNGTVKLRTMQGTQSLKHPWRERVANLATSAVMHWTLTGSVRDFPEVPNL